MTWHAISVRMSMSIEGEALRTRLEARRRSRANPAWQNLRLCRECSTGVYSTAIGPHVGMLHCEEVEGAGHSREELVGPTDPRDPGNRVRYARHRLARRDS